MGTYRISVSAIHVSFYYANKKNIKYYVCYNYIFTNHHTPNDTDVVSEHANLTIGLGYITGITVNAWDIIDDVLEERQVAISVLFTSHYTLNDTVVVNEHVKSRIRFITDITVNV